MKILFINLPYQGHFIPTIGLVKELIKRGCEVTYMMQFDWKEQIDECGADFIGYKKYKKLLDQIRNVYKIADKIADDYDLIIYEQFFFLGKHLAEKHDKPVVRIFTAPVTNKRLMDEYISAGGGLGIFKHKWICKLWTKKVSKGIPLKTESWLDEIVDNPPELNLIYTLKDFQPYSEDFPEKHYKFLGPSIYERKETIIDFKKNNRPLIYISLGTMIKGATSFFNKCIEAFRNENVDVIISVGNKFSISKLKNIPVNCKIYNTVPQLSLLNMANLFITHGGMNSINESIYYGVPMIVIPFISDQPTNARRIEALGLGKKLNYDSITSNLLKMTALSVIKDGKIAKNLLKMRESINEAPGNVGGADIIVDFYYNRLK